MSKEAKARYHQNHECGSLRTDASNMTGGEVFGGDIPTGRMRKGRPGGDGDPIMTTERLLGSDMEIEPSSMTEAMRGASMQSPFTLFDVMANHRNIMREAYTQYQQYKRGQAGKMSGSQTTRFLTLLSKLNVSYFGMLNRSGAYDEAPPSRFKRFGNEPDDLEAISPIDMSEDDIMEHLDALRKIQEKLK